MGRSYLGFRENISTSQIMLVCSYGKMFSRLPGKVSRCDVDFVKCKQKFFPLSGKVVFIWDENYLGHRDLACQQARSRYQGKLFVPYERNATFHIISCEISLVNLSKCFLGNRDNFCPYEQALRPVNRPHILKPTIPMIITIIPTKILFIVYQHLLRFLSDIVLLSCSISLP